MAIGFWPREAGRWKLEAGHYLIRSKYKVCCNRLLACGLWLVAERSRPLEARSLKLIAYSFPAYSFRLIASSL